MNWCLASAVCLSVCLSTQRASLHIISYRRQTKRKNKEWKATKTKSIFLGNRMRVHPKTTSCSTHDKIQSRQGGGAVAARGSRLPNGRPTGLTLTLTLENPYSLPSCEEAPCPPPAWQADTAGNASSRSSRRPRSPS